MENELLDERYTFEVLPDVDDLGEDQSYIINTSLDPEDWFKTTVRQYKDLRNSIIDHLLAFYDRVDYCDAGRQENYLSMVAYKDYQLFTYTFNVEEWQNYQATGNFKEMIVQYLNWGISNFNRNSTGAFYKRLLIKHPLTRYSVVKLCR